MTTPRRKTAAKKSAKPKAAGKKALSSSTAPHKGEHVSWNFGKGSAIGKVIETFREKVTRRFKGSAVTRNASPEKPAVMVETDHGDRALKSASELRPAKAKTKTKQPRRR